MKSCLFSLDNSIQPYDWGSKTALNELFGIANPDNQPQAEIWMGAHPGAPSTVLLDGRNTMTLDAFIESAPESILGEEIAAKFSGKLPYLFKVLSAAAPLSIQVHPNKQQAEAGYKKDNQAGLAPDAPNRNYRDDNHKPELMYALTPFRAMCGFRQPAEISKLFSQVRHPRIDGLLKTLQNQGLQGFWQQLLELAQTPLNEMIDQALILAEHNDHPAIQELKRLNEFYPGDAGVFSPMILNLVNMRPGEAMYLNAGTPHAYLEGTGMEIMANSDNVLRGGLTSKHMDIAELMATINFDVTDAEEFMVKPRQQGDQFDFPVPVPDFAFGIIPVENEAGVTASGSVEIIFCVEGSVDVEVADESRTLTPGSACLITATSQPVRFKGHGRLARASVKN